MKFTFRAATFAAVTFCAGALATATTPGVASVLKDAHIQLFNAQEPDLVPSSDVTAALLAPEEVAALAHDAEPRKAADPTVAAAFASESASEVMAFSSLSDAVDARLDEETADSELHCLAVGVYYESKGEPLAGQLAVAEVILNRTRSPRFPKSVCSVLTQPSQFSFVRGGKLPTPPKNHAWRRALAVAQVAREDLWDSPVEDALFFHATYVRPGWRRPKVGTVGRHVFYR